MGYTTDFEGRFLLNKELDNETYDYLVKFNETRRMARDLPADYGIEGEFYVRGSGPHGQNLEDNIIDHNRPPKTQPGLWCSWMPSEDKKGIEWDKGEKFYNYVEWLEYLIKNFLAPKGYVLQGVVAWQGEDMQDCGYIIVKDNLVMVEELHSREVTR